MKPTPDSKKMRAALEAVATERYSQQHAKNTGKFAHTCDDEEMTDPERLAVLVEEVGEVATEVLEGLNPNTTAKDSEVNWLAMKKRLRAELCQVAAVAVAWMENIEIEEAS